MEHKDVKQVIVVRKDLNMRKDKLAAQVSRVSMRFLVDNNTSERPDELLVELSPDEAQWLFGAMTKDIVGCTGEEALRDLVHKAHMMDITVSVAVDAGKAEFKGQHVMTCAAFGPAPSEEIDRITGNLTLL